MKRSCMLTRLTNSVCCLAMLLLGLAANPAWAANTYYVANGGVDAGNSVGSSGNPWATISNALKHCAAGVGGDTINVAAGTYALTAPISIVSNVNIQGTDPGAPGNTIIDGGNLIRCFTITTNCNIYNLTIQHGTNSVSGGGANVTGGTSPVFSNCWFMYNSSLAGGGVYMTVPCSFYSCQIVSNTATPFTLGTGTGAGLNFTPTVVNPGSLFMTNCTIAWNTSGSYGGGLYLYAAVTNYLQAYNCKFANNTAMTNGGSAIAFSFGAPKISHTIQNCAFISNSVPWSGGYGGTISCPTFGNISGCGFTNNYSWGSGTAMYLYIGATELVQNCSFYGNNSLTGTAAGIYMSLSTTTLVSNCSFILNTASNGMYGGGAITICDGVISNCAFTSNQNFTTAGGAIQVLNTATHTNIVITQCAFTNNICKYTASYMGGAIAAYGSIEPFSVWNCRFDNNFPYALYYLPGVTNYGCSITNCTFINHTNGALNMSTARNSPVIGCTFISNSIPWAVAPNGGGGAISVNDSSIISNCTFVANSAGMYGGAIKYYLGATAPNTNLLMGCTFSNNTAFGGGAYGGAVGMFNNGGGYATVTVVNCSFVDNCASNYGGAVNICPGSSMRNCVLIGNQTLTGFGGAVYCNAQAATLPQAFDSCTIAANYSGGGGAVYFGNNIYMTNCIVYSNTTVSGTASNNFYSYVSASRTNFLVNCCIERTNVVNAGVIYTNGGNCIVGAWPNFAICPATNFFGTNLVSASAGGFDFHLKRGSPCIDNGTNESWMLTGGVTDQTGANQAGNPRVTNGIVDIGCYEYLAGPSIGTAVFFR